jgi:hypothetical protein
VSTRTSRGPFPLPSGTTTEVHYEAWADYGALPWRPEQLKWGGGIPYEPESWTWVAKKPTTHAEALKAIKEQCRAWGFRYRKSDWRIIKATVTTTYEETP